MSKQRYKEMKIDEFQAVLKKGNWIPYKIVGKLPEWMENIPSEKIKCIYVSGNVNPIKEAGHENVIGGMDIYRHAEEHDGVVYNKDHVVIIKNNDNNDMLFVIETPKKDDPEHWTNTIPKRLENADVIELTNDE